jgi:glycosyltransferase involved in cell wall biosynthesis
MSDRIERIGILIPAFNAGRTLDVLLSRLERFVRLKNVLVVDDGSTDDTVNIAVRRGIKVVSLERNQGKGAALKTGFQLLQSNGDIDCVATLDADLQHNPEDLAAFVSKRQETRADIIVGWRRRTGTKMPLHRRMSNTITSFLVSLRTGVQVLDSQCGFRLIGKNVLSKISVQSPGFEMETEFLIKALKMGFTLQFVPIQTIYNDEGSHMSNWKTTASFIRVLFRVN